MFLVQQQGKTIDSFYYFFDAWLFCVLNLKSYSMIFEGEESWVVNPSDLN